MKEKNSSHCMTAVTFFLVLVIFLHVPAVLAQDNSPGYSKDKQILILIGPHYGLPMVEEITPAIVNTLKENGFSLDDILVEFLDLHRHAGAQHRSNLLALLEHKLEDKAVGFIITVNQGAVNFVAREGKDLLPGVPMLIPILEELPNWQGEPRNLITIESRQDAVGTLHYALDLFPETKRVLLIMGKDDHEAPFLDPILKALEDLPKNLHIETTANIPYEKMLERVSNLPQDTIAFYGSVFHDITGRSFVPAEVAGQVAKTANRPVFAFRDMHIVQGLTGGSVSITSDLGSKAANIGMDYLSGNLRLVKPITTYQAPDLPLFDWQQLKRWDRDVRKLPADTIFLNRPPTLWSQHKKTVLIALASFILLSFLVVALVVVNGRQRVAISERKQAEKELKSNYALLSIAGNTTKFGGWRVDLVTNIVTWSDEVADIHETPRGYAPGVSKGIRFYAPEWQDRITQVFTDCAEKGIPYDEEMEVITGTGKRIWVRTVGEALQDEEGKIITVQGSFQDITERKQAEEEQKKLQSQLNQAQKLESVGRLAGGVAHDFNNRLTIINGYAEMATDTMAPSDPLRETIQEIHTAGKQSADIVRQLLAFARQQTISPVQLNLNDTIFGMLKMLQRLIGENINLAWHPGKNLWPVKIDPSQVDQIMANLAVNARDAISDVGKLTIETKNTIVDEDYCKTNSEAIPGRYVMLAVSDDGCGIKKEVRDQLFEPFFTTKEIGKGTGLGLPTVYGILKQNKGFINVYSEPGEGTTFKLYIPSCETEKSSIHAAKKSTEHMPTGSEVILLVEDEKAILQISRRMLERLGYTVQTAAYPFEALKLSEEYDGTIHLLITDVVMPEMNGRELSSRLIQIYPGIKTLYMSGYTSNVIAHHGVLDEGVQFLQKPFSLKDLAVKVREAIEQE